MQHVTTPHARFKRAQPVQADIAVDMCKNNTCEWLHVVVKAGGRLGATLRMILAVELSRRCRNAHVRGAAVLTPPPTAWNRLPLTVNVNISNVHPAVVVPLKLNGQRTGTLMRPLLKV